MNKNLTRLALFTAIIMMLGLTPLGIMNIGPVAIVTVHIPVIIGAYFFSAKESLYLGFIFGLTSFIRCFTSPDAVALIILGTNTGGFKLYNLVLIVVILFVPRMLTGLFANLSYRAINKTTKKPIIAMSVSAFIGSMTNTIFFLGALYLFAFDQAAQGFGLETYTAFSFFTFLIGIVVANGVIEAIAAVVACTGVGKVIKK